MLRHATYFSVCDSANSCQLVFCRVSESASLVVSVRLEVVAVMSSDIPVGAGLLTTFLECRELFCINLFFAIHLVKETCSSVAARSNRLVRC